MKNDNKILQFFLLSSALILSALFPAKSQTTLLDSIINQANAKMLLEFLASDSLKGRLTGTAGAAKAARFISNQFWSAGAKQIAGNDGYLGPFVVAKDVNKYGVGYNVLSALEGKSRRDEVIIFSAHYDHVGTSSTNPFRTGKEFAGSDTIYNGANDNASGVVAVILLARYFAALNNNERTLLFIAFSGEELGLVGSEVMSRVIQADPIKALINIEMIGRTRGKKPRPFITGNFLSNLKSLLNEQLIRYNKEKYGNNFFINDPYFEDKLFSRSDNWYFANKGVPAHTIMLTSPADKFYHSVDDEVETIDLNTLTEVVKAIAVGSENLINGSATPNRIKKNEIYK